MKITNEKLKQIIKEELEGVLEEQPLDQSARGLENLRQHLIKLFRDHAHMFNDAEDMRGFINDVVNESASMLSKAPSKGSVVVDDPMMETKK